MTASYGTYTLADLHVGQRVRAFHPATFGVAHYATVETVGRKYVTVRWHITDRTSRLVPEHVIAIDYDGRI